MVRRSNRLRALSPKLVSDSENGEICAEVVGAALRRALSLSTRPETLVGREDKYEIVYNEVENAIHSGKGGALYVTGVPGTGKTAVVTRVLEDLQTSEDAEEFDVAFVNGMHLQSPDRVYSELYYVLTGAKFSAARAQTEIAQHLKTTNKMLVVVVDEVDALVTANPAVLYTLFNWPAEGLPAFIITIANTLDLIDRALPRVKSRAGGRKLEFSPYAAEELKTIINGRVQEAAKDLCHPELIMTSATATMAAQVCARESGDARRVLHLLSAASEVALRESTGEPLESPLITVKHISECRNQLVSSLDGVKTLPFCTRILISAILALSKDEELPQWSDVLERARQLATGKSVMGRAITDASDVLRPETAAVALGGAVDSGLVMSERRPPHAWTRVCVTVQGTESLKTLLEESYSV